MKSENICQPVVYCGPPCPAARGPKQPPYTANDRIKEKLQQTSSGSCRRLCLCRRWHRQRRQGKPPAHSRFFCDVVWAARIEQWERQRARVGERGSVTVSRCCCCRLLRRVGWLVEFLDSVLLLLVLPLCCCCAVAPKQVSLCGVRCATWFLLLCVLCAAVNVDVAVADFSVRVASAGCMLVMIFVHVGCCCLWWFLLLLLLLLLLAASTTGDAIDCCVH